eukprot:5258197-Prymnesium_polylepis.1
MLNGLALPRTQVAVCLKYRTVSSRRRLYTDSTCPAYYPTLTHRTRIAATRHSAQAQPRVWLARGCG